MSDGMLQYSLGDAVLRNGDAVDLSFKQTFGEGGFGGKECPNGPSSPPVREQEVSVESTPKPAPRPRNEVWDVCEEVLGYGPQTDTEKRLWGQKVMSLKRAGATKDKIRSVAKWYHKHWPDIDFTITALEKWYSHFLRLETKKSVPRVVCSDCGLPGGNHSADCSEAPTADETISIGDPSLAAGREFVQANSGEFTADQMFAELQQMYKPDAACGAKVNTLLAYYNVLQVTRHGKA